MAKAKSVKVKIIVQVDVPQHIYDDEDWMGNGVEDYLTDDIPDTVYYTDDNGGQHEMDVIVLSCEEVEEGEGREGDGGL